MAFDDSGDELVDVDQLGRRMLEDIDHAMRRRSGDCIADVVSGSVPREVASAVDVYVVDLQQTTLVPIPRHGVLTAGTIKVDGTQAGNCFQLSILTTEELVESALATGPSWQVRVWVPLVSGSERLGVIGVLTTRGISADPVAVSWLERLADTTAELIQTSQRHSDSVTRLRRTREMDVAAEIQWALLPPLAYDDDNVSVCGALEPAYEVAGDTFDYAVDQHTAQFALLDAVGHGLYSAQLASLAVAAYRNARRGRASLAQLVDAIESVLTSHAADHHFATGILGEINVHTGRLRFANAGHHPPLLLREGRLVGTIDGPSRVPMGLVAHTGPLEFVPIVVDLLPDDRILMFTDGVVEARSPEGAEFGVERLVELVVHHLDDHLSTPESMRRIIDSLLHHQQARLRDDATLLLIHWHPTSPAPAAS